LPLEVFTQRNSVADFIHPSIYLHQATWPISCRGTTQKTDRKEQSKKLTVQKVAVQLIT